MSSFLVIVHLRKWAHTVQPFSVATDESIFPIFLNPDHPGILNVFHQPVASGQFYPIIFVTASGSEIVQRKEDRLQTILLCLLSFS